MAWDIIINSLSLQLWQMKGKRKHEVFDVANYFSQVLNVNLKRFWVREQQQQEEQDDEWPQRNLVTQCDQFGRFFKFRAYKFTYKSNSNICWLFGLFWKTLLFSKNCGEYFWTTFGRYWATFSLPSCHTAWRSQKIENLVSWAESVRERERVMMQYKATLEICC